MKTLHVVLLMAGAGAAFVVFIRWRKSTRNDAAPVVGPGGGHTVPATAVVGATALFAPPMGPGAITAGG